MSQQILMKCIGPIFENVLQIYCFWKAAGYYSLKKMLIKQEQRVYFIRDCF